MCVVDPETVPGELQAAPHLLPLDGEAPTLEEEERARRGEAEDRDDRKRKYNSMKTSDVTEEEMEAYRMKKVRGVKKAKGK